MGVLSQKCVRSYPNNTDELLVWGNLRYTDKIESENVLTRAKNEPSRYLEFPNH